MRIFAFVLLLSIYRNKCFMICVRQTSDERDERPKLITRKE